MQRRISTAVLALLMAAACGGSDSGSTAPNNTSARQMSAKVDGNTWTATSVGAGITNGIAIIVGTNVTQTVSIAFAAVTGTQTITPTGIVIGQVTIGTQTWQAGGVTGTGTGTVTVTTASANHLVGTFSFTAQAVAPGTSPASRQVTTGTFDVTF